MNSYRPKKQEQAKEYEEAVIQIDRVTRVVKGGRRLRFRATVCIGNQKGKVGLGIGKSGEVVGAISKAVNKAKKALIQVPLNNATVPHEIRIKYKSSELLLKPASEGTGIIAGGAVRKVLELVGVKNVLSKAFGSSNRVNMAKATMKALFELQMSPQMERNQKSVASAKAEAETVKVNITETPNLEKMDNSATELKKTHIPKEERK